MPPLEVVQAVLDDLDRALMAGDWGGYLVRIALPFTLRTGSALLAVETEADLRAGFEQYRAMLQGLRVTDYIRVAHAAREVAPDLVEGDYDTNMLAGGQRVVPPFPSTMTIARAGGTWRASRIETTLLNARWPVGLPIPPVRPPAT